MRAQSKIICAIIESKVNMFAQMDQQVTVDTIRFDFC